MDFSRLALYATLAALLVCARPAPAQSQDASKSIPAGGDQTLVLPSAAAPVPAPAQPKARAPQPSEKAPAEQAPADQEAPEPELGSDNAPLPADLPAPENNGPRPYLGITVLYAVTTRDGQKVSGLRGRTPMTTTGATGATMGELLGPLDGALRPLLAKSGQLGQDGDLIVAIDDHRVTSDSDLPDHLARLHPGDIIYLTVLRQQHGGMYKAVKMPITLGFQKNAQAAP